MKNLMLLLIATFVTSSVFVSRPALAYGNDTLSTDSSILLANSDDESSDDEEAVPPIEEGSGDYE